MRSTSYQFHGWGGDSQGLFYSLHKNKILIDELSKRKPALLPIPQQTSDLAHRARRSKCVTVSLWQIRDDIPSIMRIAWDQNSVHMKESQRFAAELAKRDPADTGWKRVAALLIANPRRVRSEVRCGIGDQGSGKHRLETGWQHFQIAKSRGRRSEVCCGIVEKCKRQRLRAKATGSTSGTAEPRHGKWYFAAELGGMPWQRSLGRAVSSSAPSLLAFIQRSLGI